MHAISHPLPHNGHQWAIAAAIGVVAAAIAAMLLSFALSTTGSIVRDQGTPGGLVNIDQSTRDRANVQGPCFAPPRGWNDAVAGPVPECR